MNRFLIATALLALPLAACDGGKGGTTIQFNSSDADGNTTGVIDGNSGQVSINAPGFSGSLKLPKIHIDSSDFNMNGVKLYPDSTVSGMNVNAHDSGKDDGDDDGTVTVNFSSPAKPGVVQGWFLDKLNHAGFSVKTDGTGLSGFTDDKKPFRLDLSPDGSDKAKGVITMG